MNKRYIAEWLAKFYLRYGRGRALLNFISDILQSVFYLGGTGYIVEQWFGISFPKWIIVIAAVSFGIFCYIVGEIDERVGFWKFQNNYATKSLTPFFDEMDKKIDKINEWINGQKT